MLYSRPKTEEILENESMKRFQVVENGWTWVNMFCIIIFLTSGTNSEDTIWVLNHI